MVFKLNEIVPWGRSFEEYVKMFNLTEKDLLKKILSCGDGPASFNAEMKKRHCKVTSCDPIYKYTTQEISSQIDKHYNTVIKQLEQNKNNFIWKEFRSSQEVGAVRMKAMQEFLRDFKHGKKEGRYFNQRLPHLSFNNNQFDLALCSHFLFLYTPKLSFNFHQKAVSEMLRVAKEARIFPICDLDGKESPYVQPLILALKQEQLRVEIEKVDYEFQRGSNRVLKICKFI